VQRATRTLFWATFAVAFAATLVLITRLRATSSPLIVTAASASRNAPESAQAVSQTRVHIAIAPTVVHVPLFKAGPDQPQPSVRRFEAKAESLKDAGANSQSEFVSSILGANTSVAESASNLLPDRPVIETARNVPAIAVDARRTSAALASAKRAEEEQAVIAVLAKYSRAWNAKDLDDIRALRPGLARRTLKEELAAARSIQMQIHPVSAPKIEGDRAMVECLHRVDQVFEDGTEKQSPGVHMTYVLVKRGGTWLIADTR
jgi:hypothetical protein